MGGDTHSEPIRHGRNSHAGRVVMEKSMQVKEMNAAARSRYFTLASGLILDEVDGVVFYQGFKVVFSRWSRCLPKLEACAAEVQLL